MHKCLEISLDLSSLLDFVKNLFIIVGGTVALASYRSQNRQRGIDNSFNSLKMFEKTIQNEDIEIWKKVYFNTYESTHAEPNHFVVFSEENRIEQIPLSNLFISEGQGLYVSKSKLNLDEKTSDLKLGSIRRITEQLNLIGYEVLYGNIELRIIYYELGQIIETIYEWITQIQDEDTKASVEFMYPYFLKMYQKYQLTIANLPRKSYVNFC